MLKIGGVKREF